MLQYYILFILALYLSSHRHPLTSSPRCAEPPWRTGHDESYSLQVKGHWWVSWTSSLRWCDGVTSSRTSDFLSRDFFDCESVRFLDCEPVRTSDYLPCEPVWSKPPKPWSSVFIVQLLFDYFTLIHLEWFLLIFPRSSHLPHCLIYLGLGESRPSVQFPTRLLPEGLHRLLPLKCQEGHTP
jgi:hypothetical protein